MQTCNDLLWFLIRSLFFTYILLKNFRIKIPLQRNVKPASYSVRSDLKWVLVRQKQEMEVEEVEDEELSDARYFLHSLEQNKSR